MRRLKESDLPIKCNFYDDGSTGIDVEELLGCVSLLKQIHVWSGSSRCCSDNRWLEKLEKASHQNKQKVVLAVMEHIDDVMRCSGYLRVDSREAHILLCMLKNSLIYSDDKDIPVGCRTGYSYTSSKLIRISSYSWSKPLYSTGSRENPWIPECILDDSEYPAQYVALGERMMVLYPRLMEDFRKVKNVFEQSKSKPISDINILGDITAYNLSGEHIIIDTLDDISKISGASYIEIRSIQAKRLLAMEGYGDSDILNTATPYMPYRLFRPSEGSCFTRRWEDYYEIELICMRAESVFGNNR